ncbi:hypothetical protein X740_16690 [Mesorhizobium sp. LNHC221B00]|nr:hypothetical protein X740_16690 [Mesorhizobium sp. LNHC221B00]
MKKSSPRRAFCFKISIERARRSDSSSSLIVPFMPNNNRSFGCVVHRFILIDDHSANQATKFDQRVPVAPVASQTRHLDANTAPTRPSQIAASSFSKPDDRRPNPSGQGRHR